MAIVTVVSLPEEILVHILTDSVLSFSDAINFSATCKHLYKIVRDNNQLWRVKFFRRWPLLKEAYRGNAISEDHAVDWKEEVKASINSRRKLLCYLSLASSKHFDKNECTEFREVDSLFCPEEGAHPLGYYFLVDELISLIRRPAITSNLTHRYYALKVIRYLRQCHLKNEWKKFVSLPQEKQTLEYAATIVAQWCQPGKHISYSHISSLLDNIANQVKELLKEQYPNHSIFSTPEEKFHFWKTNVIDDNQWSVLESRQITDALCEVLFRRLEFYGNSKMYYWSKMSFIDQVLEKRCGNLITLAIIFESIARRLGVRCEPMSFPAHFLLRWKEAYGSKSEDVENFYIDVFHGGQFLTKESCFSIAGLPKCQIEKYDNYEPATTIKVIMKLAKNVEAAVKQYTTDMIGKRIKYFSALQLQLMIQPNMDTFEKLSTLYTVLGMDVMELIRMIEDKQDFIERVHGRRTLIIHGALIPSIQPRDMRDQWYSKPRSRVPGVKYAVGLIMKHKIHGYLCVIAGWVVNQNFLRSRDFNLGELFDQPIYFTFKNGGQDEQVAQEYLVLAQNPKWINNYGIGRYFCAFNGTHYLPNEETASVYPEDEKVRNELIEQAYPNWNTK